MALLTATKPLDMVSPGYNVGDPQGTLLSASATTIVVQERGGDTVTLTGSFALAGTVPVGGQLDGVAETGAAVGYEVTGLDATYQDLLPLVQAAAASGDGFQVLAYLLRGADSLIGSAGNDRLIGLGGDDTVVGGSGDDDVNGNTGNDFVYGNSGVDFVRGGQGNDYVFGGNGDDWHVNGNIGDDTIHGDGGEEAGNDTMFGGQGADLMFGDFGFYDRPGGNDLMDGNLGDDDLFGEAGNDTLSGGEGNDVLRGEEHNDSLLGGAGDDVLFGGLGDATIDEPDADILIGGAGDDLLLGEGGNDTLTGGIGADNFIFESNGGDDRITDFTPGTDALFMAPGLNGLGFDGTSLFAVFQSRLAADGQGNTVIDLGQGHSVLLQGVLPGQLGPGDFGLLEV
ncbi:hemolysin type calcium-binding protein [Stella humosa]|uniref:Hemolysin type calcium-binding protein n=2 Tax=cellular organisms TaxID=131567 RepID=A0A3N1MGZ3_9PROT|nr:calcium-binding protein [Stella humosa]ROQ01910.1 hemolysin type calcium-binding protein [Stella humosa]BBK32299.1 hypothetical protein STHU_29330 [Stella humosa]